MSGEQGGYMLCKVSISVNKLIKMWTMWINPKKITLDIMKRHGEALS